MQRQKNNLFAWFPLGMIFVSLLFGCAAPPAEGPTRRYPTPTTSLQFDSRSRDILLQPDQNDEKSWTFRDALNLFSENQPHVSPSPTDVPSLEPVEASPLPTPTVKTISIYDEELNRNWMIQRSTGMEVNFASNVTAYSGNVSLAITPGTDISTLSFTIQEYSSEKYSRDEVLGLSFWLNSGEETLNTDELAVTVLGSNAYPYWVQNDNSVKSVLDPVFSETRLYYLGINRSIPPDNWVKVELWLDDRIYDPDYNFVTGFYIKSEPSVQSTIFIDDVQLIILDTTEDIASTSSSPELLEQTDSGKFGVSNQLQPVWSVQVDVNRAVHPISPLIYGVTTADEEYLAALNLPLNSWGGNPSSRYNWKIGHAWNAGRDYFFRNGNYGITSGSASDMFVEKTSQAGAEVRLTVPTLGWVAKNDDLDTCSFPLPNGECSDVPQSKCEVPIRIADPFLANVRSDVNSIREWMKHLFELKGFDIRFIAMDNEPELWGWTHYDVHPECTTYQEILDKFLEYAMAVREVAPRAEITGPVTSGWYHYWNSSAGAADKAAHGNQHFLNWFLDSVKEHDENNEVRTLDVLDIHYYPQGVYNEIVDEETSALRLRSTRSLWDPNYIDESWIAEPVYLIPRMQQLIREHYPGTRLGISEWNWGADQDINGALAIADVLGIFGREDLYFAAYYSFPPKDSPGFFAFKIYRNYDDQGSGFGDTSVWAQSTDANVVSSFAAVDNDTGNLHLILINKEPEVDIPLQVYLNGFSPRRSADQYQYSQADLTSITKRSFTIPAESFDIMLPAYSITLLIINPDSRSN